MTRQEIENMNRFGDYGCSYVKAVDKALVTLKAATDNECIRQKLIDKWKTIIKVYNIYGKVLGIMRDDVLPSWDNKSCGAKLWKDLKEAVGGLCGVELKHYKTLTEIVLHAPEYLLRDMAARPYPCYRFSVFIMFNEGEKRTKISAEATIKAINDVKIPLIHEEIVTLQRWIDNVDTYLTLNADLLKAIEKYNEDFKALSAPLDARLYVNVEPSVTIL